MNGVKKSQKYTYIVLYFIAQKLAQWKLKSATLNKKYCMRNVRELSLIKNECPLRHANQTKRMKQNLYTAWFQPFSCCWPGVVLPSLWGQCWCRGPHPPPPTPTWETVWSTRATITSRTHPPTTITASPGRSTDGAGIEDTTSRSEDTRPNYQTMGKKPIFIVYQYKQSFYIYLNVVVLRNAI